MTAPESRLECSGGVSPRKFSEKAFRPSRTLCLESVLSAKNSFFFQTFAKFWRARSRLYQNESLQVNMRLTAFFKLYKMCTLFAPLQIQHFSKTSV